MAVNILPGMPADAPGRSTIRPVDAAGLTHIRHRLERADRAPWLHGEVARRMGERLLVVKDRPRVVLDWWAHIGGGRDVLVKTYPQAQVMAVESTDEAARRAAHASKKAAWWSPKRWSGSATALLEDDVPAASAQLVWANMMLHGTADPAATMTRWQKALAVDGFLMFSTLGPGTLEALSAMYRELGWPRPFAPFVDMHDLGDMLIGAGFGDPVMDQETITLTWGSAAAMLAELRSIGGNADPARHSGLRTPRWQRRLEATLVHRLAGPDGRLSLAFEVVYGHAFRPLPRVALAEQTTIAVEDLRTMARARKPDVTR